MWKRFVQWLHSVLKSGSSGGEGMDEKTKRMAVDQWKLLKDIISEHDILLKQIEKAQDTFDGELEILKRQQKRLDDPNHKIVANYSKIIVGMKSNYMMGKPVSHEIPEDQEGASKQLLKEFKTEYKQVLEDNDDHAVDFLAIKRGLIAGASVVLFYFDEHGEIKYRSYMLNECIPIFDAYGELKQVIHRYTDDEEKDCVEIWDTKAVTYLVKEADSFVHDTRQETNPVEHFLPIVPAAVFINGEFAKPKKGKIKYGPSELSNDVQSILEKLSQLVSDNHNRLDMFCDPFLVFKNANVDADEILKMRKARAIKINGSGGNDSDVSYLLADLQNEPIEWQAMKLIDILFETTNTPKIFKQEAQGALSSVAIRQLYTPLDNAVNETEIFLNQYIRRKIMVITLMLNVKKVLANGGDPNSVLSNPNEQESFYDWRWVFWEVHRNLPQNDKELVETLMLLADKISDHTLLSLLPQIENADEEIKRIRQEQIDSMTVDLNNIDKHLANNDKRISNRSMDDGEE